MYSFFSKFMAETKKAIWGLDVKEAIEGFLRAPEDKENQNNFIEAMTKLRVQVEEQLSRLAEQGATIGGDDTLDKTNELFEKLNLNLKDAHPAAMEKVENLAVLNVTLASKEKSPEGRRLSNEGIQYHIGLGKTLGTFASFLEKGISSIKTPEPPTPHP